LGREMELAAFGAVNVPAACPIGRSAPGTHGHSRAARYAASPADGQAGPLPKPTV